MDHQNKLQLQVTSMDGNWLHLTLINKELVKIGIETKCFPFALHCELLTVFPYLL